jgi:hypothetical protein
MIKAKIKGNIDTKKVKKNVQTANFKSVEHAVAAIRQTAIRMIRQGRMKDGKRIPSQPGNPPKKWTNKSSRHINRSIGYTKPQYSGRQTAASVYASPENSGDQIYKMLEYGGSQNILIRKYSEKNEPDPIKRYYKNKAAGKIKKIARYKARPFLDPAVQKNLHKIPEIWKSNIKRYFH